MDDKEKFLAMHKEYFISAYSDLTAFTAEKEMVVLLEIENTFAHVMKYFHNEMPEKNIQKATGHIYRTTLDCYKMLWERMYESVSIIDEHRGAYEGDEISLLIELRDMNETVLKARKKECEEVGGEELAVLTLWRDSVEKAKKIYVSINKTKLRRSKTVRKFTNPFYLVGVPSVFFVLGIFVNYFLF